MNGLENFLQNKLDVIDNNKIVNSLVGLFLVLYAGLAAPKLPRNIAQLFDYTVFKLIVLFLIAYLAHKDKSVAIMAVVALVLSFQTLTHLKLKDLISKSLESSTNKNTLEQEVPVLEMPVGDNEVNSAQTDTDEVDVNGYSGNEYAQV